MTAPEEATLDISTDDLFERLRADVRKRIDQRLSYVTGKRALIPFAFGANDNEVEAFTHPTIDRNLLILGEPGTGKTTTLLKLADALLRAHQLPYIFELSSWEDDGKSLLDWMSAWLKFDYGIPDDVSRLWVQENRLVPLLDGLDELDEPLQKLCVGKINEFAMRTDQQVVVCCRHKDYDQGQVRLSALNGELCIQPLTRSQIQQYLQRSKPGLWESVLADPHLLPLLEGASHETETPFLQIPLFLQMFVIAYEPESQIKTKTDLLEAYISHQLRPETRKRYRDEAQSQEAISDFAYATAEDEPTPTQTKHYLIWFAQQLKKNARTNTFLIERMQPSWLETTAQKWQYRLMLGLIVGLIGGLLYVSTDSLSDSLTGSKVVDSAFYLVVGLAYGLFASSTGGLDRIRPVKSLISSFSRFDLKKFRHGLITGMMGSLIGVLLIVLLDKLTNEPIFGQALSLRNGLTLGLTSSLIIGLVFGLTGAIQEKFKTSDRANQGIVTSAKKTLFISAISYFPGVLFYWLPSTVLEDLGYTLSASFGLSIGWSLGCGFFYGGGVSVIQYVILRFLLHRQGHIPHNYAQFLRYTTERRLTQQIGGHFRFIHRELLDHFAVMDVDASKSL